MLKKEEYLKTVRREYPVLYVDLVFRGFAEPKQFEGILEEKYCLKDMINLEYVFYYGLKTLTDGGKISFKEWINPEKFDKAKKILIDREHALIEASRKDDVAAFCDAFEYYMPALALIFVIDKPVGEKIRELVIGKLEKEEGEKLLDELNIPLEDNYNKKEEYNLVMADDIEKHVKEYEWIKSRYGKKNPYTAEQAKEHLAELNKDEFLEKWNAEKERLKASIRKAKNVLGEDAPIVDLMQFIIFYRTHRTDTMNRAIYLIIPAIEKRAKELGISYKQALYCTREELLGKPPSKEILDERTKDFSVVSEQGNIKCVIGKELEKVKEYLKEDVEDVKEFRGTPACKGLAKGKAKIIYNRDDFDKVEEGDILVTSMTTPDMIPIMKKASAFVTDEGGITCHAAIISREMKKPCVIGTKIASEALKDGDTIEVDANEGVVRVLKHGS